ncbi:MAG: lysophospholipid acyltransferase family protein [Candidatus Sumerlaeota bacterium]
MMKNPGNTIHRLRRSLRKITRPLRHRVVYWTVALMSRSLVLLGLDRARRFGAALALGGMRLFPGERRKILKNIEMAYRDELDAEKREQLYKASVRNLGMMAAEGAFIATGRDADIFANIRVEGEDTLSRIPADCGLLFVTAHYGLWETMPRALLPHTDMACAVVAREIENPHFEKVLNEARRRNGVTILTRGRSGREYIRFLRQGNGLAVLGDIDTRKGDGLFVEFFGRPAWTQRGIARLAKSGKAMLAVGFIERDLDDPSRHTVKFGPLVEWPETRNRQEWEERLTQAYTHEIERAVRRRPDQWMWMHRRWRHQPDDPKQWRKAWEAKGLAGKAPHPAPDPRIFRKP